MVGLVLVAGVANAYQLGLVAGWNFDPDVGSWMVTDTSPSGGMDGAMTAVNTIVNDPLGMRGGVLDAQNGYAQIPVIQKARDFSSTFTLQAWVGIIDRDQNGVNDEVNEQWKSLVEAGGVGPRMFSMNSAFLGASQFGGDGWNPVNIWRDSAWDPGDPAYDGTGPWHHLLLKWDGSVLYGYVDGVMCASVDRENSPWWQWGDTLTIGLAGGDGTSTEWLIDDVAWVHGYLQTDQDVVDLMNGTTTLLTAPWVPEPATIALLGLGGLALIRRKR
jgi:hypothetical protein